MPDIQAYFQQVFITLQSFGPWGVLVFIVVYVAGTLVFIPIILMFVAAGALFGIAGGFLAVSIATVISATGFFLAGRHFSRGWMLTKIATNPKIRKLDDAVTREGWKMVFFIRMSPILPFWVINYGLGLSKIPVLDYMMATWLGMAPGMLLYVCIGSFAGDMVLTGGATHRQPIEWAFMAIGMVIAVTFGIKGSLAIRRILRSPA